MPRCLRALVWLACAGLKGSQKVVSPFRAIVFEGILFLRVSKGAEERMPWTGRRVRNDTVLFWQGWYLSYLSVTRS